MRMQVGTGATTHYPNLLRAALVGAGYAVSSAVPGAAAGSMGNSAPSAGYVLKIQNLPEGTAKYDIVKVWPCRSHRPQTFIKHTHPPPLDSAQSILRSRVTIPSVSMLVG